MVITDIQDSRREYRSGRPLDYTGLLAHARFPDDLRTLALAGVLAQGLALGERPLLRGMVEEDFAAMMASVTRNVGAYVMVLVMTIAFGILGSMGILACGVGILITAPYAQMCTAHLFGQLAQGNIDQVHPAEYS